MILYHLSQSTTSNNEENLNLHPFNRTPAFCARIDLLTRQSLKAVFWLDNTDVDFFRILEAPTFAPLC